MVKGKRQKRQTTVDKPLHRKVKIQQNQSYTSGTCRVTLVKTKDSVKPVVYTSGTCRVILVKTKDSVTPVVYTSGICRVTLFKYRSYIIIQYICCPFICL
jgi:hypothetical protein